MSLSRKETDEIKSQIEKTVNKFLGFAEPDIVSTAVNCITSGHDRRKTAGLFIINILTFVLSILVYLKIYRFNSLNNFYFKR